MSPFDHAPILLLALIIDAVAGDPGWLYRRVPHPVVLFGAAIDWCDRVWNRETFAAGTRRAHGVVVAMGILALFGVAGWVIHLGLQYLPHSAVFEAVIASVFFAQNSLYWHVSAVERGFVGARLGPARAAVALIVGRDPASLDQAGVCRAAIESLAENFSDGIVAPALWYLLFGLPGLFAYKALNTADSMIGHRSDRHLAFGWASARLDDLANLVPARVAALAITIAANGQTRNAANEAKIAALRDARRHRSVNAGWPEAAMAGALGLRLAGPRLYDGVLVEDAWMGNGRADAMPDDIRRALRLYLRACLVVMLVVAMLVAIQG
jgi:adenosylcobinamide-phosphate synthase